MAAVLWGYGEGVARRACCRLLSSLVILARFVQSHVQRLMAARVGQTAMLLSHIHQDGAHLLQWAQSQLGGSRLGWWVATRAGRLISTTRCRVCVEVLLGCVLRDLTLWATRTRAAGGIGKATSVVRAVTPIVALGEAVEDLEEWWTQLVQTLLERSCAAWAQISPYWACNARYQFIAVA